MFRNAMEIILQIGRTDSKSSPSDAKIAIVENVFMENLALDTVYLAANRANVSYNSFDNSEVNL